MNKNNRTYTSNVNEKAFKRTCQFCKTRKGAVVYCQHANCRVCFHVLCGHINDCVLGWNEEQVR